MNSFAIVAFFACLAATNAGYHHGHGIVLQGPSSKTTLVGPEGSVISAVAPGGQVAHEEHPGYVAHAAPAYAHIAPVAHYAAPHAAPHATVVAHSSAYHHDGAVIAGPSGTIATGYGAHAPVAYAHGAPALVAAHAYPVAHHGVYAHGHEGQYVPDHSEALYDDGSYKPHLYSSYHH